MSIQYLYSDDGRVEPAILCDVCNEPIARDGTVLYLLWRPGREITDPHFAHDGACAKELDRVIGGGRDIPRDALDVFLSKLKGV